MIAAVAIGVVLVVAAAAGVAVVARTGNSSLGTDDAPADAVVTFAEYEAAVDAAMECARANSPEGTSLTAFLDRSGKYYRFASSGPAERDDLNDPASAAFDACLDRWLYPVEREWMKQEAITAAELPAALGTFIECVNRAGVEIPGPVRDAVAELDLIRPAAEQLDVGMWAYEDWPADTSIPDCVETAGLGNLSAER